MHWSKASLFSLHLCLSRLCSASLFAYGMTSSGKTYTTRAVTQLAVGDIFDQIRQVGYPPFCLPLGCAMTPAKYPAQGSSACGTLVPPAEQGARVQMSQKEGVMSQACGVRRLARKGHDSGHFKGITLALGDELFWLLLRPLPCAPGLRRIPAGLSSSSCPLWRSTTRWSRV